MVLSLLLAFYSFGLTSTSMLPDFVLTIYGQWAMGILFLLIFAAAAWIIYPFFSRDVSSTTISRSELGVVDISLNALDNLVSSVAIQQEGIIEISNRLKAKEDGLSIYLSGKVAPDISIPKLTQNLQVLVKSYIEDTAGVNVSEVRVLIEGVSSTTVKRKID